jgi:hypothetical protein
MVHPGTSAAAVVLTDDERATLERWVRRPTMLMTTSRSRAASWVIASVATAGQRSVTLVPLRVVFTRPSRETPRRIASYEVSSCPASPKTQRSTAH